jgi:hypothetical protein
MIIVDRKPLEQEALNDKNHNLHNFAVLMQDTLLYLQDHYKNGVLNIKKVGYPKFTEGADSNFRKLPKVVEPTTPWRIPLRAYVAIGDLGKHTWMCCLDPPEVLANGLYDMPRFSKRKAISIEETLVVNINEQPDLAFFMFKISPFLSRDGHNGLFKILDPMKEDEEIGTEQMAVTRRKYAVWNMLQDVDKLKRMARAYGIADVESKQPNAIRKELEELLERNDSAKKQNPAIRGTAEFEEEMQVTDSLLLRAFVQKSLDEGKLEWKTGNWYAIGEKKILQVPQPETSRRLDYLCSYLMAGSNEDKLQEFIKDLINKDYITSLTDKKELAWLCKIAGQTALFKKPEEVTKVILSFFCPV